jgi:type III secretory pathway component EscU
MTQVLLTILIIINIVMFVGMGIIGYVIYKKFIKPIRMSKSTMTDMKKVMDMMNDFKVPNQWKK